MAVEAKYSRLTGDASIGGVLHAKGKEYQMLAKNIADSVKALTKISGNTSICSKAMSELRELAEKVKTDIDKTQYLYKNVGDELLAYRVGLAEAKKVADPAADKIAELESDKAAVLLEQQAHASYQSAYNNYQCALCAVPKDQDTIDSRKTTMDNAEIEWNNAKAKLVSRKEDIENWRKIWLNNNGQGGGKEKKDQEAEHAASRIDSVFDDAKVKDLKDGFWDKLKAGLKKFYDIFKTICDIAGILSLFLGWVPFLGQILSILGGIGKIITMVSAVITMVSATIKLASGEISLGEFLGTMALGAVTLLADKIIGALGQKISGASGSFGKLLAAQMKSPFSQVANSGKALQNLLNKDGAKALSGLFGQGGLKTLSKVASNSVESLKNGLNIKGSPEDLLMRTLFGKDADTMIKAMMTDSKLLGDLYAFLSISNRMYKVGSAVGDLTGPGAKNPIGVAKDIVGILGS